MGDAQDTLFTLAEVAIALAGFSAIVVVLKRGSEGRWSATDADRFHGMVIHAICAVVFCLFPAVLNAVVQDAVTTFHIAAALLGVQILCHAVAVMFFATTDTASRLALGVGVCIGLFQGAVFTDWGIHREFEIYQVGVIWHILQAGVLFVMLIWIPRADIDEGAG